MTIDPFPTTEGVSTDSKDQILPPEGVNEVRIRVGTGLGVTSNSVGQMRWGRFESATEPEELLNHTVSISTFKYNPDGSRDTNVPPPKLVVDAQMTVRLEVEYSVSLKPHEPAILAHLEMRSFATDNKKVGEVDLFDSKGAKILQTPQPIMGGSASIRLERPDIAEVVVTTTLASASPQIEFVYLRTPVLAIAKSSEGMVGPFVEKDGVLSVKGIDLGTIYLGATCGGQFLILELSIPSLKLEAIQHTVDALEQFNQSGPILEPETNYRLTVAAQRNSKPSAAAATNAVKADTTITEQVYFRTAGLPGIDVPDVPEGTQTGDSSKPPLTGFEDLSFYVHETIPAVPAPVGGHQVPARAFYRSYDQAIAFAKETPYVELMYRLGRRDLSLRLFDVDGQPLRDANGRVVVASSRWEQSADTSISKSTADWIEVVNNVKCVPSPNFSSANVVRSEVTRAPSEDGALAPEVLHQARVIPILLHESFTNVRSILVADGGSSQLDHWAAEQNDPTPSKWQVLSRTVTPPGGTKVTTYFVRENSKAVTALAYKGPLASVDNTAHPDHPSKWSDVRVSVQFRWSTGEVGLDVRRHSDSDFVRILLDRDSGSRQLQSSVGGVCSILAEDTATFPGIDSDVAITVICEADRVQVFQQLAGDDLSDPIFDVTGAATNPGTVALISFGADKPEFTEVSVHDLRPNPSTAYRFDFVTSKYSNFYHHLHSFGDQLFGVAAGAGIAKADLDVYGVSGIDLPASPSSPGLSTVEDAEARAYTHLEELALQATKLRQPEGIEIIRANKASEPLVFLLRSPEPLLWTRIQPIISVAQQPLDMGIPGACKLTGVAFGSTPIKEFVSIEIRQRSDLTNCSVEWRALPTSTTPDPAWTLHFLFGDEKTLDDGTTILLFSGDASQAPARSPGTTQRFVATDSSSAKVTFPTSGVELRLLGPGGKVIHQRQFLPDSSFTAVNMRAVRKPDGTGLVLFAAKNTNLPSPGTLRCSLRFLRDLGSTFPVLSQAGDKSPEVAVLDVKVTSV